MEQRLVLRGVAVGALAGLLAFIFSRIFVEPVIQTAIDYESRRDDAQMALDKAAGHPMAMDSVSIFSRDIQRNIGIGTGLVLFGVTMGALFAVAFIVAYRRSGRSLGPRTLAALVAGGGFLAIYFVPFLKYPANPPAIGHPATIRDRGLLYLTMVVVSLVALIAATVIASKLRNRLGAWNSALVSGLGFVVIMAIVMAALPSLGELHSNVVTFGHFSSETPQPLRDAKGVIVYPGFPADTLFKFRLYSVINQVILWGAIGLAFGALAERLLAPAEDPSTRPVPDAYTFPAM
jgi:hypothetical protein